MKLLAPLALAALLTASASAQSTFTDPANLRGERVVPLTGRELPIDQGATGLEQLLRKLNTRASLMLIVAHPDDEDGGMLTYYSRGLGARVADLSLNRGEGGHLHTVSFGRRLRDFRYRPNLALRDFGLLESGREDKKRLISGFYFYYAVARWQAGSCHYCGYLLSFLAASKGLRAMELSPLLARLRYRNTNTERP